jgi:KDZ transposase family protein
MNTKKNNKRKRGRPDMIDGDVDSAPVVTERTITEIKQDGRTVTKRVWVSLDIPQETLTAVRNTPETSPFEFDPVYEPAEEPANMSPPPRTNKPQVSIYRVRIKSNKLHLQTQKDYIEQYVDRMEELLEALVSRESMPEGAGICRHCNKEVFAIWRCKDCLLSTPMCRLCMRQTHKENPFHRIQQWTGQYFRPAELWEVGSYLLVRHYTGEDLCPTLRQCCDHLENSEITKDNLEQVQLRQSMLQQNPVPVRMPGPDPEQYFEEGDIDNGDHSMGEEDLNDENDIEEEVESINPYLSTEGAGAGSTSAFSPDSLGSYIRVVHSNGVHYIAMIGCQCRGEDSLPLDLIAAQLLPASFKRIKTLFTTQVLDTFRLCNLELKASAYQFYQLIRRLTNPMAPGDVINLYREFRRMSRLSSWQWMKKLKWAGYAGSSNSVTEVGPGGLSIYCPACPQPGINIPNDWKEDTARYVERYFNCSSY